MTALPPLSHLDRLEAESLHILREVAAEFLFNEDSYQFAATTHDSLLDGIVLELQGQLSVPPTTQVCDEEHFSPF